MSEPALYVSGATHQTAPLELREKLAPGTDRAGLHERLARLPGVREFALLSTCNRLEFYTVAESPQAVAAVESAFCASRGFDPAVFQRIRVNLRDRDAVQHLFNVAAGIESQMVGENEIFGQVKEAYAAAQQQQTAGPVLNRLFQKAFQAAKHARTHTAIAEGQVSVASVAVDLALNIFGSLVGVRTLLLGAGDIAGKTGQALLSRGATSLAVSSRTLERAAGLAAELKAATFPFAEVESRLAEFDIVIGSTAAGTAVVQAEAVRAAMHRRRARPLFLIDLALPRDIDPAVARLENVFLYNLDDLALIAEKNRAARVAEIDRCRVLLRERVDTLWPQLAERLGGGGRPEQGAGIRGQEI